MHDLTKQETWEIIVEDTYQKLKKELKRLSVKNFKTDFLLLWLHPIHMPLYLYAGKEGEDEIGKFEIDILAKEYENPQSDFSPSLLDIAAYQYLPVAIKRCYNEKLFEPIIDQSLIFKFSTADCSEEEVFHVKEGENKIFDLAVPQFFEEPKLGSFLDSRDGRKYPTIEIGNQEWLGENLAYEIEGKEGRNLEKWRSAPYDKWCYYNNDKKAALKNKHGILYQKEAAKIACPKGWRLPNNRDWHELLNYISRRYCGNKLPENENRDEWLDVGTILKSGKFGFKSKGLGRRIDSEQWWGAKNGFANGELHKGTDWFIGDIHEGKSDFFEVHYGTNDVRLTHENGYFGFSVRCIKET